MYSIEQFHRRRLDDQHSLTEALAWASHKYYVEHDPPMSDYEFDIELKQLQALEEASGMILPDSPTQRVGSDIQGGFEKRRHLIPMQSIENVYDDEQLHAWLVAIQGELREAFPKDAITFTYEPKYDGVSISLIYVDGILTDAVTRGNQEEGESVYENVKTIRNVPLRLHADFLPHYFEVRGEVLMSRDVFERLNAERSAAGERLFANKRNAAAGSLKQLDPKVTARRALEVNAFAAYTTDPDFQLSHLSSQEAALSLLLDLGFSLYTPIRSFSDIEMLTAEVEHFDRLRRSQALPYDCDGVVVKVNQYTHRQHLGLGTTAPRWCKARKFPQEAASTRLLDVTYQVGMTGHITPVAELEPTVIAGSLVSRATLNNENYIRSLDLRQGCYVYVQKAGEVIPQVVKVDKERSKIDEALQVPIVFPTVCPSCGTHLLRHGEYWICPNHHCREQVIRRLEYWCGKDCADIRSIGPSVCADLVDRLGITSVDDLYRTFLLDEEDYERESQDLADMEGFGADTLFYSPQNRPSYRAQINIRMGDGYGPKSIALLFEGVAESVKRLTLDRIIGGFGIDGVGKITGKTLAAHFGSLETLSRASIGELEEVSGIGEVMARNIADFFSAEGHYVDYSLLSSPRIDFATTFAGTVRLGSALEGMTLLFTGTSSRFKREEIKAFLAAHGAKCVGSVSGKLSYLIVGDAPGQNKLDKATSLGVKIISEADFYEKFGL